MRASVAIFISLTIHGILAVAIWLYIEYAPGVDVSVSLDLNSVELSFAETESEATPSQSMPSSPQCMPSDPARPASAASDLHCMPSDPARPDAKLVVPDTSPDPDSVAIPKPLEAVKLSPPTSLTHCTPSDLARPASAASPAPAPRQARVDAPPRPKRNIKPDYPRGARQRGEQGEVTVEMRVDESGAVSAASVVASSGFPELDEAALRAVRSARFTPAKSGGKSVAATARIALTFKLK